MDLNSVSGVGHQQIRGSASSDRFESNSLISSNLFSDFGSDELLSQRSQLGLSNEVQDAALEKAKNFVKHYTSQKSDNVNFASQFFDLFLDHKDSNGQNLLMYAIFNDAPDDLIDYLIKNSNLGLQTNSGQTVLMYAIYKDKFDLFKVMTEQTSFLESLPLKCNKGETAFMWAVKLNKLSFLEILYEKNNHLLNEPDEKLTTPLMWGLHFGYNDIITFLLNCPNIGICNHNYEKANAIMYAAKNGLLDSLQIMKQHSDYKVALNDSQSGYSVFQWASFIPPQLTSDNIPGNRKGFIEDVLHDNCFENVEYLSYVDDDNKSLLMHLSERGYFDIINLIKDKCTDQFDRFLDHKDKHGHNALMSALFSQQSIDFFLDYDNLINTTDFKGITPMMHAFNENIAKKNLDVPDFFTLVERTDVPYLKRQADGGMTILMRIAQENNVLAFNALRNVMSSEDFNELKGMKDNWGQTALQFAQVNHSQDILRELEID